MRISEVVPDALDGERLDRVVAVLAGLTRSLASELVSDGSVTLNGVVVTSRTARVLVGSVVGIDRPGNLLAGLAADPDDVMAGSAVGGPGMGPLPAAARLLLRRQFRTAPAQGFGSPAFFGG